MSPNAEILALLEYKAVFGECNRIYHSVWLSEGNAMCFYSRNIQILAWGPVGVLYIWSYVCYFWVVLGSTGSFGLSMGSFNEFMSVMQSRYVRIYVMELKHRQAFTSFISFTCWLLFPAPFYKLRACCGLALMPVCLACIWPYTSLRVAVCIAQELTSNRPVQLAFSVTWPH